MAIRSHPSFWSLAPILAGREPAEALRLADRFLEGEPDLWDFLWLTLTDDDWKASLQARALEDVNKGRAPKTASPLINDFLAFAAARGQGLGTPELFAEWEQLRREARRA